MIKKQISTQSATEISKDLIKKYPRKVCFEILKELKHQLDSADAKVYYCGQLTADKKRIIHEWLTKKTSGNFEAEYIEDPSLIGGIKIVYKDFIFDSSILGELRGGK